MIIGRWVPHMLLVAFVATGVLSTAYGVEVPPRSSALTAPIPQVPAPAAKSVQRFPMVDATGGIWENLVVTDEMVIDVEPTSIKQLSRAGGYEIFTRMRIGFFHEINIQNHKEKGWYYINEMVAVCKGDVIRVQKSTVYDKDGKELVSGKDLGELRNPKDAKSFVTLWLYVTCNDLKHRRPPTMI